MFNFTGSKSIFDKAEITRVIFENSSVTIEFQEGYEENETFVPVGSDHIILTGQDAADFTTGMKATDDNNGYAEEWVASTRAPEVVEEPEPVE